jgi:hypothetical protein
MTALGGCRRSWVLAWPCNLRGSHAFGLTLLRPAVVPALSDPERQRKGSRAPTKSTRR